MKKLIALLMAMAMVLCLAACGGSGNSESTAAPTGNTTAADTATEGNTETKQYEGITITYWSMWNATETQALVIAEAAEAFQEETGATVNIEWKGRDINTLIMAALESGENIDLFDDDYQRIAQQYVAYTADLTDMAAAAGYTGYDCLNSQVIAWAGYLNSIVEQPQVGGIFYNKAAFETAGITSTPTTWEEFLEVCQQLTEAGIAPLALDSAYSDFTFYHQLVRHLGEEAIETLAMNGGWSDSEGAVAAAQEIVDFVNAGYLAEGAPDTYPSGQNKLGTGEAAMIVCANYVTSEVDNVFGEQEWGLFNYPAVDGGVDNTSAYGGANSFAITSYSENQQAAFDFIMYLTTGEYDQKMADEAGQIPCDPTNTCSSLPGAIETLSSAESIMSWCNSINVNSDLATSIKAIFNSIYEGAYSSGEEVCAALDALY